MMGEVPPSRRTGTLSKLDGALERQDLLHVLLDPVMSAKYTSQSDIASQLGVSPGYISQCFSFRRPFQTDHLVCLRSMLSLDDHEFSELVSVCAVDRLRKSVDAILQSYADGKNPNLLGPEQRAFVSVFCSAKIRSQLFRKCEALADLSIDEQGWAMALGKELTHALLVTSMLKEIVSPSSSRLSVIEIRHRLVDHISPYVKLFIDFKSETGTDNDNSILSYLKILASCNNWHARLILSYSEGEILFFR